MVENNELEKIEVELLLKGVFEHYGFDFRDYAENSLTRRLWYQAHAEKLGSISALQDKVLHDSECMERLLLTLSINVTAMFRDPLFYLSFRQNVVPLLRTYPFIRIWHAGCATGEEVYSMAILLKEEGLLERSRLYATDINAVALQKAKAGIFSLKTMKENTDNYNKSGGQDSFSKYYSARYKNAIFSPSLKENMIFSQHNLVTDGSFNEFNVILCRNVLIYFNDSLQKRVHELIYQSLCNLGILCLGKKESLLFTGHESLYDNLDERQKIYKARLKGR